MRQQIVIFSLFLIIGSVFAGIIQEFKLKDDTVVTVQATNNTKVPNIVWTVDAVECLKEAITVYVDEPNRASAYLELFNGKHPGNWSVAVGYTTIISDSDLYVETIVSGGGKSLKKDKSGVLYRIFN
ncbi:unnamed protein product [Brassicogethes aeneus]|uniref:Uncharacterized protein n=1 Tax=Brassicogethes aeneus TaxID=1431903 RepID=A0A9P0B484_BRAAE|nr:unnamed protein product [Brassicogethes aeneus]